jgi:hypothetical protein
MSNLTSVVTQLEQERNRIQAQLKTIQSAIAALHGKPSAGGGGRGGMTAAGRARIAAAQRARWARVKAQKPGSSASRSKRRMSPAAIARIRAAQKTRWAKWRKEHKG